jgi:hypothetical protein
MVSSLDSREALEMTSSTAWEMHIIVEWKSMFVAFDEWEPLLC